MYQARFLLSCKISLVTCLVLDRMVCNDLIQSTSVRVLMAISSATENDSAVAN